LCVCYAHTYYCYVLYDGILLGPSYRYWQFWYSIIYCISKYEYISIARIHVLKCINVGIHRVLMYEAVGEIKSQVSSIIHYMNFGWMEMSMW
jgi:hypothetical protein